VSIYRGDDLEEELKLSEAKVNPKLPAELFKPDAPVVPTPTPTPTTTPGPVPATTPKPKPSPTTKKKGGGT
jgi:hypothetical protein